MRNYNKILFKEINLRDFVFGVNLGIMKKYSLLLVKKGAVIELWLLINLII